MNGAIDRITIKGYKSIRNLDSFELGPVNVLIGANGAGKSNFVGFFRLLRSLVEQRLQMATAIEGGADACLFLGPKITSEFSAEIDFGENRFGFALRPSFENRFVFTSEDIWYQRPVEGWKKYSLRPSSSESRLKDLKDSKGAAGRSSIHSFVYRAVSRWSVYHFDDTSALAAVRRPHALNDDMYFRGDASNLPAFLYRLRVTHRDHYERIRDAVRMAAPFFDDFTLRPVPTTPDLIQLEWLQKDSDYPFRVHQMSDGTLRFVCLATALLQPEKPATMLFDEPELGLHPHALGLLAALFRKASSESQLIISTQSASLLSEFAPEDVVVVERSHGESTFRRLDALSLTEWLEDYSLGELWEKNILGGRPKQDRFPDPVFQR